MKVSVWTVLFWAMATFVAAGQDLSQAGQDLTQGGGGRILLATVVDANGKPQLDLGPDDFVISEGGAEREPLDVHVADYPVVLLIDNGLETSSSLAAVKDAVVGFIVRIGERPVALGTLNLAGSWLATFEDDRTAVLDRVREIEASGSNADAAATLPAVAQAARLLQDTGAPFSAIVIVTPKPVDASQTVQGDLLPAITQSGAAVHVIENRSSSRDGAVAADLEAVDLLRVLSEQTHGQYTTIFSSASYRVALDKLADRMATELMVEYLVPAQSGSTGDVRVGVRRPGARVVGLGVSK